MSKFFHEKSQFNKKNALKTVFWSVLGIFRKNCKQIFSSLLTYLSTQRVIWMFQRPSKSVLTDFGHSKRLIPFSERNSISKKLTISIARVRIPLMLLSDCLTDYTPIKRSQYQANTLAYNHTQDNH